MPSYKPYIFIFISILLIGFIFGIPDLLGLLKFGNNYTPFSVDNHISSHIYDESRFYAPYAFKRIQQSQPVWELDILEYKDCKNPYTLFYTHIIAILYAVFQDFNLAWSVSHFLFPMLIYALMVLFLYSNNKNTTYSITIVSFWVLVCFAMRDFWGLSIWNGVQPLTLSRTPQPSISLLFLLMSLLCYYHAFRTKLWWWAALSGVATGFLCYNYYFYWTAMFFGMAISAMTFLAYRMFDYFKIIFVAGITTLLTGGYYIYNTIFENKECTIFFTQRTAVTPLNVDVKGLAIFLLVYLLFLFVVYAIKNNKYNLETLITWFIPLIGGAFCFNLHLLTGKNAEHGHYLNRIIIPFLSLLMIIFISNSLIKQHKIVNSLSFYRLLLLFYFMMICQAFNKQYRVSIKTISYHNIKNPDHDILYWANNNIKKVSVIGTSNEQFILMMPLTKHWNFVGNAYRTHASDKELLTRYAIICKILNFSLEQTLQSVSSKITLQNRESIINAGIDKKELKYLEQQMATIDVKQEITTKHLDYILYPATWSLDNMLPIVGVTYILVYSNSQWAICKLEKN